MNDQEYFLTTSLSYQLRTARRELAAFRSGDIYQKMRRERDELSFTRKAITRQWTEVLDDVEKEYRKEIKKLKKAVAELLDMVASLTNRNTELDEKRKKLFHDYYEAASHLEEAEGLIVKLRAQANHNYENSSLPSSKCIRRQKITNNREKSGRKPGAQPGHEPHPRQKLTPDQTIKIQPEEKYLDTSKYQPTGRDIVKQVAGIKVSAVVTQYSTEEFYD